VDDCAATVLDGLEQLAREQAVDIRSGSTDGLTVTKILASKRSVRVGSLLMEVRRVIRRQPRPLVGSSTFAKAQARDRQLRSTVWRSSTCGC
jgi:UDP-glucose 4-epimerase